MIAGAIFLSSCKGSNQTLVSQPGSDVDPTALADLTRRVANLEMKASRSVVLKLSDTGFSPLQTDVGTITLQLKKLEGAGSGTRAELLIGNPTSADITKFSISGMWGAINKDGVPDGPYHSFAADINQPVNQASWSRVSFIIDGAKPTDIGFIEVTSGTLSQIKLITKP